MKLPREQRLLVQLGRCQRLPLWITSSSLHLQPRCDPVQFHGQRSPPMPLDPQQATTRQALGRHDNKTTRWCDDGTLPPPGHC